MLPKKLSPIYRKVIKKEILLTIKNVSHAGNTKVVLEPKKSVEIALNVVWLLTADVST